MSLPLHSLPPHRSPSLITITPPDSFKAPSLPSLPSPPLAQSPSSPASAKFLNTRPSSSQTSIVIKHLRDRQSGRLSPFAPWLEFWVPEATFQSLFAHIQEDKSLWEFFQAKIRYDYSSEQQRLVLRMPTPQHELVIAKVASEICKQLHNTQSELAKDIEDLNSPTLKLQYEAEDEETREPSQVESSHTPDRAIGRPGDAFPGVVLEVAFSQNFRQMKYIAEEYILGSGGNIRVVVAINMEYRNRGSKRASISIWRSNKFRGDTGPMHEAKQELNQEDFRDDDGNFVNGKGLELQLRDFATTTKDEPISYEHRIFLSASTLFAFVEKAESAKVGGLKGGGDITPLVPGTKTLKRHRTPEETLASDDERRIQEMETRAAKKQATEDSSFSSIDTGSEHA